MNSQFFRRVEYVFSEYGFSTPREYLHAEPWCQQIDLLLHLRPHLTLRPLGPS